MSFNVKFWGVRGSIACPSPNHIRYGGNTSCVEFDVGTRRIVFDAGTGIRGLGQQFMSQGPQEIHLLLTHTHWDHINGFPFFVPAYVPGYKLHIMAGHLNKDGGVKSVLSSQMENPMFPVPIEAMQAEMIFQDFQAGEDLHLWDDVGIKTAPLNHPNGATGYRVEYEGRSACYVTDTEHRDGELDRNILELIEGADLVIYDCTYTEEEMPAHIGWGHSTWNEGVKLCKAAGAKRLCIFHHDPDHDDRFMDALVEEARAEWEGCFAAIEGETIEV